MPSPQPFQKSEGLPRSPVLYRSLSAVWTGEWLRVVSFTLPWITQRALVYLGGLLLGNATISYNQAQVHWDHQTLGSEKFATAGRKGIDIEEEKESLRERKATITQDFLRASCPAWLDFSPRRGPNCSPQSLPSQGSPIAPQKNTISHHDENRSPTFPKDVFLGPKKFVMNEKCNHKYNKDMSLEYKGSQN